MREGLLQFLWHPALASGFCSWWPVPAHRLQGRAGEGSCLPPGDLKVGLLILSLDAWRHFWTIKGILWVVKNVEKRAVLKPASYT